MIAWSGVGMVVTHDPAVATRCLLVVINSPVWVETGGGRAVCTGNGDIAATYATVGVGSEGLCSVWGTLGWGVLGWGTMQVLSSWEQA